MDCGVSFYHCNQVSYLKKGMVHIEATGDAELMPWYDREFCHSQINL